MSRRNSNPSSKGRATPKARSHFLHRNPVISVGLLRKKLSVFKAGTQSWRCRKTA